MTRENWQSPELAKQLDLLALGTRITTLEGQGGLTVHSDADTLVSSSIGGMAWRTVYPAQTARAQPYAAQDASGNRDLLLLNPTADAPADGGRFARFVTPGGATKVQLRVPAQQSGGAATLGLRVLAADGAVVASATPAVLSNLTTLTLDATVTPGTEYIAAIYCNGQGSSVQARALVGRVQVAVLTGGTGVFAAPYLRFEVTPALLTDNARSWAYDDGRYWRHSPFARLLLDTTAQACAVELVRTNTSGTSGRNLSTLR